MIVLDTLTKKLELVLAGAVTANQLQITAFYSDEVRRATVGPRIEGQRVSSSNNTTDVTIVPAPGSNGTVRSVNGLSIYNKDTATAVVTIKIDDSGTETILKKVNLRTIEALHYDNNVGWYVVTATGGIKSAGVNGPSTTTDNAIARWDGVDGAAIQDSSVLIDDSNNVSAIVNLAMTGAFSGATTGTFSSTLSVTGHTTFEGVTSTGATGTGNLVYSASPTLTGTTTVATLSPTTVNGFTLAGTIAGGGNQLNNIIIGTSTPLAGAFTTLSATGALTGITAAFTKAAAGDVITFTNGGATPKTGYLHSGSDRIGLFNGVGSAGNGIYIDATTSNLQVGSVIIAGASSAGLAVTGTLSATNTVTFSTRVHSDTSQTFPSALAAAGLRMFTNSAYGAVLMGYGATGDLSLANRAGNVTIFIEQNTTTVRSVGNFVPDVTGVGGLGTSSLRWADVYGVNGNFSGNVTLGDAVGDSHTVNGALSILDDGVGFVLSSSGTRTPGSWVSTAVSSKTGYLYSDGTAAGITTEAGSTISNAVYIDTVSNLVAQRIGGNNITIATAAGFAITGTLSSTGNAGVGTAAATDRLTVKKDEVAATITSFTTLRLTNAQGSGNFGGIHFAGALSDGFIGHLDSSTATTHRLVLSASTAEDFWINGSGNATFAGTLTVSGHMTLEGVTSTGATGTGNFVFSASPTFTGTLTAAVATFSSDVKVASGAALYIDGGGDTYIIENAANSIDIVTGGTSRVRISSTGLGLIDTNASHHLRLVTGSDLTADRVLTLTTGDAARTLTLSGNPTLADWFDQAVKVASSPTFVGLTLTGALSGNGSTDIAINTNKFTVTASSGNTLVAGTLSVTGHATLEGVTSTGATGTGNLVFSASPTVSGTLAAATGTFSGDVTVTGTSHLPVTINSRSAAYTTVLGDAGQTIYHPSTDNNARTFTIDSNANVAYVTGTVLTFINEINTVTIAITSDTLTLAGTGSTGSRTLAANGVATAIKVTSTKWVIAGTNLS